MSNPTDVLDSLRLLQGLLHDVAERLEHPSKADRRAAALKLDRVVAIASTLSATIHTPRQ